MRPNDSVWLILNKVTFLNEFSFSLKKGLNSRRYKLHQKSTVLESQQRVRCQNYESNFPSLSSVSVTFWNSKCLCLSVHVDLWFGLASIHSSIHPSPAAFPLMGGGECHKFVLLWHPTSLWTGRMPEELERTHMDAGWACKLPVEKLSRRLEPGDLFCREHQCWTLQDYVSIHFQVHTLCMCLWNERTHDIMKSKEMLLLKQKVFFGKVSMRLLRFCAHARHHSLPGVNCTEKAWNAA